MPPTQTNPDVKLLPSKKTRSSEKLWLPVWKDRAGAAVANSAGFLPVMPYYEPVAIAVYHFVKFNTYSDANFRQEIDALNSTVWGGFDPYQAWISEIHSDGVRTLGNSSGESVHYVIRCIDRTDGWKFLHPDAGLVYDDAGDIKAFKSVDGDPFMGNLDGSGGDGGTTLLINVSETKKTINFNTIVGLT